MCKASPYKYLRDVGRKLPQSEDEDDRRPDDADAEHQAQQCSRAWTAEVESPSAAVASRHEQRGVCGILVKMPKAPVLRHIGLWCGPPEPQVRAQRDTECQHDAKQLGR